jgi:hypothetical protein
MLKQHFSNVYGVLNRPKNWYIHNALVKLNTAQKSSYYKVILHWIDNWKCNPVNYSHTFEVQNIANLICYCIDFYYNIINSIVQITPRCIFDPLSINLSCLKKFIFLKNFNSYRIIKCVVIKLIAHFLVAKFLLLPW